MWGLPGRENVISKIYRTAENFGGGKLWQIWRFATNLPKFYPPIACNI